MEVKPVTMESCIEFALTFPGAVADAPFAEDTIVLRHRDSRKWFGLLIHVHGVPCINLKCDPQQADFYRHVYRNVTPAYHMNKTHWNTIVLDGDVPEGELQEMIAHSYALTASRRRTKA